MAPVDGTPDDPRGLLGAWALDALDDGERARVDALLESDPEARAEADRLAAATGRLADAAAGDEVAPSGLLDSILTRLDDRPAGGSAVAAGSDLAAVPDPTVEPDASAPRPAAGRLASVPPPPALEGADPASTVAGLTELERRRAAKGSRRSRAAWVLSAAAVVVLVLVGAVAVLATRDDTSNPSLEEIAAEARAQPGARTADLVTDAEAVAADVVVDADGHAYLTIHDMPATDAAHTYQLWSVDGGTPISLGLFDGASTVAVLGIDHDVSQLAVTLEPAGGSADPTTAPMASGTLRTA